MHHSWEQHFCFSIFFCDCFVIGNCFVILFFVLVSFANTSSCLTFYMADRRNVLLEEK